MRAKVSLESNQLDLKRLFTSSFATNCLGDKTSRTYRKQMDEGREGERGED